MRGLQPRQRKIETVKLVAYTTSGHSPRIRPASAAREWMDQLPEGFGYRCLPLNIANMHGWEILAPHGFSAYWDGGPGLESIRVEGDAPESELPSSHFGHGVLTFQVGLLFRSEPGINLMVTGPLNRPKHGIFGLSGIIETDWSPYSFTMNWKFTAPHTEVFWEESEPFAFFFPLQCSLIEAVEPEIRSLDDDPDLAERHRAWREARLTFNRDLREAGSEASRQRWQKDYYRGLMPDGSAGPPEHRIKLRLKPFES
jgi:hypothetical protein